MSSRPRTQTTRNIERSCAVCHRRKVRCDKRSPCSQCTRGGFPCSYPPVGPIVRRTRKTTINDVASRISEMEKTLEAFRSGQASTPQPETSTALVPIGNRPPEPETETPQTETSEPSRSDGVLFSKGRVSHYVNEVLFSRIIEQEHDVRTALTTPRSESPPNTGIASSFNPMGILSTSSFSSPLASYHPPKRVAMKLWKLFVDCVDVCTRIAHIPTTEVLLYTVINDPFKASIENLGLCFAIYYAAATSLHPDDPDGVLGEDRTQALHRFKTGLEQALAQTDFLENPTLSLLQALAIYLAAMRAHNSGRAVWIMNGLAIRAAQSMGLDRDGTKLGLSPFESEIRRRLWWHFLERDGRGAEDYGIQNPGSSSQVFGVDQPRNLHDSDLSPDMKELPPSRPGWTRMTLPLVSIQVARAWAQLYQLGWSADGTPGEEVRAQVIREAISRTEDILQRCNPVVPEQKMTIIIARLILRKLDIVTRRQWQTLQQPDDRASWATESDMLEAMELLEHSNSMWQDEDLQPYYWVARAFPQYHMMAYILRYLCVYPHGPNASRAFAAVETHLEGVKGAEQGPLKGLKWTVLVTLRERAMMLMQSGRKDNTEVGEAEEVQDNMRVYPQASYNMSRNVVEGIQQNADGDLVIPDWNTLLQEFPLDVEDFSLIF
ncbi:hypothetical protein FALBO_13553 [Fusarium albosuccineum]|uniref:Zn(2)-C6 fungal-type domain-containing protein n=1 Tax=Fusarium albosuccineum TaxID=1237068 RepID=A0A8H4L0Z5_9HYPO|nr:hypothetical protein FALBO_13553 [Fusarium albosuccineum]